jgi:hypothetical protein
MNPLYESPLQLACYDNDLDAFVPELWAHEALELFFENTVVASLVYRDFENIIQDYGDVVHTRRPVESKIRRRTDTTAAATLNQAASATDVLVPLNQWFNQTFTIRPGELSKSFADLVQTYLQPRIKVMARGVDRAVLGVAAHAFLGTPTKLAGRLAALDAANVYGTVVEVDKILNENKAPQDGRSLLLAPSAKAQMLLCDKFVKANERGDGGNALQTATLGQILGFDTYLAQNVNSVLTGADIASHTVTDPYAAEYAGAQSCTGAGAAMIVGEYVVVAGNDQPTFVTATATDSFTLNEPNKYATADNAIATRYKKCASTANYPVGYSEGIVLDGYTAGKAPQVGQLLAFGTGASRRAYTVIESEDAGSTCTVLLDRPLELAVANDDSAFPGPYGSINLALHRNALALVTRPLAAQEGAGMMSTVMSADGIGIRVAMQDKINEGRVVAIDLLAGVAVLDTSLCVPLLG